jgi:hypothetical protein
MHARSDTRRRTSAAMEGLEARRMLTVVTVDSRLDTVAADGVTTLREAILYTNTMAGPDEIRFNVAGGDLVKIDVTSPMPPVTDPVLIDGRTQPGFAGKPIVQLLQIRAGEAVLDIIGGGTTVRGFILPGIRLRLRDGNIIQGNYLGTDLTGNAKLWGEGIQVLSNNNLIGGIAPVDRNVIHYDDFYGIMLGGRDNVAKGNYIGIGADGSTPFDTRLSFDIIRNGVILGGLRNVVGGSEPGAGNVISANAYAGINIEHADKGMIQGNFIGTDAAGRAPRPNLSGILLLDTASVQIGGFTPTERNIISGNAYGLDFESGGGGIVRGNYIGASVDGGPLANEIGVDLDLSGNNVIGGSLDAANLIAFNRGTGVRITDSRGGTLGTRNAVRFNSIFSNGGLGIDLGGVGVTPNDLRDPDAGANTLQNFPLVRSVSIVGGNVVTISASLNSTPATTIDIDFYASGSLDPSGHGEGQTYIGTRRVATDILGNASFTATFVTPSPVSPASFITATATDLAGNTSEFSAGLSALRPDAGAGASTIPQANQKTVGGHATTFSHRKFEEDFDEFWVISDSLGA